MTSELARSFEAHRAQLHGVAYRMLGSRAEADDAVQEAWLRLSRVDPAAIGNLGGWLTTVISRICLDLLRSRKARREDPIDDRGAPIDAPDPSVDPNAERALADSVSLALLVVLETLAPAERLAFVLHDMFDLPFDEIAPIVGRTPTAARQLASRARRRVQGASEVPAADLAEQRRVVDAFLAAVQTGDFDALVAILDPEVVRRIDTGAQAPQVVRGAAIVARGALGGARANPSIQIRILEIDGRPCIVASDAAAVRSLLSFTIADGKILEIDVLADPAALARYAP